MTILSDPRGTMPMRSGIGEPDYGTPKSTSEVMVSVTIDGETHVVPEGTSVMRAASESGCAIPKLCATDSLQPFGSCHPCRSELLEALLPRPYLEVHRHHLPNKLSNQVDGQRCRAP